MIQKPLGHKAYGSIPHLPDSRLGPGDHFISHGQADICIKKKRDKHDHIIVQEKIDGSNVAVALLNNKLIPLTRTGYIANTSNYKQHLAFYQWAFIIEDVFREILNEGERICGEWAMQAHGTIYQFNNIDPFFPFDIFNKNNERIAYKEFIKKITYNGTLLLNIPHLLHEGIPLSIEKALILLENNCYPCDKPEGVVYRVERKNKVDFLAKFVRHDKQDGIYIKGDNKKEILNWIPSWWNK